MKLQQGSINVSEYTAKFEEFCMFSIIYQHKPNEAWKCVKFEGSLKVDVLTVVKPMEIRNYAILVNKCRLVEEYNKKLRIAKSDADRKRLASKSQEFEHTPPPKKQFQVDGHDRKQLQRPIMRQGCPKFGKYHGGRPFLAGHNMYFRCGEPRHIVRDCPHWHQPPAPKLQHQDRSFS